MYSVALVTPWSCSSEQASQLRCKFYGTMCSETAYLSMFNVKLWLMHPNCLCINILKFSCSSLVLVVTNCVNAPGHWPLWISRERLFCRCKMDSSRESSPDIELLHYHKVKILQNSNISFCIFFLPESAIFPNKGSFPARKTWLEWRGGGWSHSRLCSTLEVQICGRRMSIHECALKRKPTWLPA